MNRRRDIKLDKYEISSYAYRELLYFCRQYPENKEKIRVLENLSASKITAMPKGSDVGNPTESKALKAVKLRAECEMIESIAHAVIAVPDGGDQVYKSLVRNITEDDVAYEVLNPPIGRNQFYRLRRMFFYYLALEKGKI